MALSKGYLAVDILLAVNDEEDVKIGNSVRRPG